MLRVVLAVLLATALLGVGLGALEAVRPQRTERLVAAETATVVEAIRDLAGSESAVRRLGSAARRRLALDLPAGGLATVPVDYVSVGGVPGRAVPGDDDSSDVVAYRLQGGRPGVVRVPIDVRVATGRGTRSDDEPLVVRGESRLSLSLVVRAGRRVVVASRGWPRYG